jgi:PKD repeat protein
MMNKKHLTLYVLVLLTSSFFFWQNNMKPVAKLVSTEIPNKLDKKTRADLAMQQNFEMTKDPKLGYVPRERLWEATKQLKEQERRKGKAAIAGFSWRERGPSNVSGRTRTVMFDPNDASNKRVFAGSVSGGLWVTDDIYAAITSWTAVDEFLENLAIGSIAYDPSSTTTMYFGTGEGFYNIDAARGDGIFKSTNGGSTWSQLASTTGSTFNYTQKIVVDASGNIYAATRDGGIQKSTNGGTSWSTVLSTSVPATGTNATTNRAADMEISASGDIYVAMGIFNSDGIYKSTNSGISWAKVYNASGEERIEIACAPSDNNYVYALTQDATTNAERNFLRTTNGGTSWTTLPPPTSFSSQTWYNISLSVDPNDETDLYTGGLELWKSTNSGTSFTKVAYWSGTPYVHADHHTSVFAPGSSDSILFGNDGGVFLTENGTVAAPSFKFKSNNYNVTQFYSGAIHPTAKENYFLAGAQDNGSQKFTGATMSATTEVTGGDGAYVHIDQDNPSYQFTSYVFNQYRRSTDGGSTFTNVNFSSSAGKFINPTDYDNDAQIMYCSWGDGVYMRWTDPRTGTTSSTVTFSTSGTGEPSALFCDPNTANRLYIGTDDGEIWRINSANGTASFLDITETGMSGNVSSIDVEDGDANHLLATFSNYGVSSVWESTNGGTSWTNIEGNLPDMPVRWGMFNPLGSDSVFLATELGVWTTDNVNGSSTVWGASNTGLANVRTDMLQWRASDSTLLAATHGRGLYSTSFSEIKEANFDSDRQTVYLCTEINFLDASIGATSWAWDFDNDGTVDATTQDPSWTYTEAGYKAVKLVINGTDSVTKSNFITVLPNLGTPYTVANGGNFESNGWHFGSQSIAGGADMWELGGPSNTISSAASGTNVWKTDLDADILQASYTCALYSPSFNLSNSGTYTLGLKYRMEAAHSQVPLGVYVEYSINSGASWSQLGTYNGTNNWYSTTSNQVVSSGICWSHTLSSYVTASVDASLLAGNSNVRFRVVLQVENGWSLGGDPNVGYQVDGFSLDDFTLSGPSNDAMELIVETDLSATATANLGPNETVTFVSANCKILAKIQNLSTHDYGATTVTIDNAGASTQDFSTNTASSKQIADKTLTVIPTTNNTSGSYKITTYFSASEATTWKTNTGQSFKNFNQVKSPGSIGSGTIANSVYGASPSVDSTYNGSDLAITASYSSGFSGFGGGLDGTSGPLPVDLLSFRGRWKDGDIELKWTTSQELNVSHFEIQKFNEREFFTIGQVTAEGNSVSLTNYDYLDNQVVVNTGSPILYRLKMVDFDGSFKYSDAVTLRTENIKASVSIYPLPAINTLNVSAINYEGELSLEIVDVKGRTLITKERIIGASKIDIGKLSNGVYFVTIQSNGQVIQVKKIIVAK